MLLGCRVFEHIYGESFDGVGVHMLTFEVISIYRLTVILCLL